MCNARDELPGENDVRRLAQVKSALSWVKGGGGLKVTRDKGVQADVSPPLQTRMLLPSLAVLAFCLLLNQIGLFVPVVMLARNCVLPKTPTKTL